MIADEDRIVFEVKPNATAYGYSMLGFATSLIFIGFLIYTLINPPADYSFSDKMLMYVFFVMMALLAVPFALIPVYKRVMVDEDSITIKKLNRSVTINVNDIYYFSKETKFQGKPFHLLTIKYGKEQITLQDTFAENFLAFQFYLEEFVDRSKCEVRTFP